jgi:hypothetical protein
MRLKRSTVSLSGIGTPGNGSTFGARCVLERTNSGPEIGKSRSNRRVIEVRMWTLLRKNPGLIVDMSLVCAILFLAAALGVRWANSRFARGGPEDSMLPKPGAIVNLSRLVSGLTVLQGKCEERPPVLLVFWTPKYVFCKKELPIVLPEVAGKVNILSIVPVQDADPTSSAVGEFLAMHNLQVDVCADESGKMFGAIGVSGTPSYLLVDIGGKVKYSRTGTGILEDSKFWKAIGATRRRQKSAQSEGKRR